MSTMLLLSALLVSEDITYRGVQWPDPSKVPQAPVPRQAPEVKPCCSSCTPNDHCGCLVTGFCDCVEKARKKKVEKPVETYQLVQYRQPVQPTYYQTTPVQQYVQPMYYRPAPVQQYQQMTQPQYSRPVYQQPQPYSPPVPQTYYQPRYVVPMTRSTVRGSSC